MTGCPLGTLPIDLPLFLGNGEPDAGTKRLALSVVAFAFLGAYVASIRALLRSVANFDLSPLTLFRCSAGMLLAIFVAGALWRGVPALGNPGGIWPEAWLLFAFTLGLDPALPERVIRSLWRHGKIKQMDEAATDRTRIVPLELIDGIDGDVRARLEDFNLYDVQNLATANPILLFVETPFGIYQSIDWVAQAQLATGIGVDRFLRLRELGVRTIFDLETVLLGPATPGLLEIRVATILLPPDPPGTDPDPAARIEAARRMAYAVIDDLSARRLRQMWKVIEHKLGEFGPPMHGPPAPSSPPARLAAVAARVRRAHRAASDPRRRSPPASA